MAKWSPKWQTRHKLKPRAARPKSDDDETRTSAEMPQAARGGRADAIYHGIFEAVVEHRLPPGAKLAEEQLGAIYSASRTIVRSALQDLAHDTSSRSSAIAARSSRPRRSPTRTTSSSAAGCSNRRSPARRRSGSRRRT